MKWSIGFILTGAVSSIWELGKHLSESLGMSEVCIILLDGARHGSVICHMEEQGAAGQRRPE